MTYRMPELMGYAIGALAFAWAPSGWFFFARMSVAVAGHFTGFAFFSLSPTKKDSVMPETSSYLVSRLTSDAKAVFSATVVHLNRLFYAYEAAESTATECCVATYDGVDVLDVANSFALFLWTFASVTDVRSSEGHGRGPF